MNILQGTKSQANKTKPFDQYDIKITHLIIPIRKLLSKYCQFSTLLTALRCLKQLLWSNLWQVGKFFNTKKYSEKQINH